MSTKLHTFMEAPSCAAQNCLHKGIECARRKCISKVRKFFVALDKQIDNNIAVHEESLKKYNAQLAAARNTSEKKTAKALVSLTKDYLDMYRSYSKLTTEKQKLVWFSKYFMT